RIIENSHRMSQLINDLLTFSRLGRQPIHKQRVNPSTVITDVLDDLHLELVSRKVQILIASSLPECEADPALLRLVYANLLSNALKYSRPRTVARIEVGWMEQGEEVVYFVKDNGVGFDMKYADKLFGVFQRLHRQEDFEGTGVGLANVQRIIHRHGGRIWGEAEVDQGATFYFTLVS
ncbi:MAG TPA: ATP-binding protein, partial [Anaerolineales bacterium]|nr:ATP-binding protein [Anaerolineales bacterium]